MVSAPSTALREPRGRPCSWARAPVWLPQEVQMGGSPKRPTVGGRACAEKALAGLPVAFLPALPRRPLHKPVPVSIPAARGRTRGFHFVPGKDTVNPPLLAGGTRGLPGAGAAGAVSRGAGGVRGCGGRTALNRVGLHAAASCPPVDADAEQHLCAQAGLPGRPCKQAPGEVSPSRLCGGHRPDDTGVPRRLWDDGSRPVW